MLLEGTFTLTAPFIGSFQNPVLIINYSDHTGLEPHVLNLVQYWKPSNNRFNAGWWRKRCLPATIFHHPTGPPTAVKMEHFASDHLPPPKDGWTGVHSEVSTCFSFDFRSFLPIDMTYWFVPIAWCSRTLGIQSPEDRGCLECPASPSL